MMFGNVAPAPLSWTCAAAHPGTAAPSSAARARNRVDVMSDVLRDSRLERELSLEVRLRPRGLECRRRRAALVREHVDTCQEPQGWRQLIGSTADETGEPVVPRDGVGIGQIEARDQRGFGIREVVDAEHAGDTA